ncbi:MAG: hypothetical protein HY744_17200 [Deltaproteobacteria bacterium]|nr:hypothetical protein [Deltaproteobacteria bacterium]
MKNAHVALGWKAVVCSALVTGAVGLAAACSEGLRLEPPGPVPSATSSGGGQGGGASSSGGEGGTTTSTSSSGGAGPVTGCVSNTDCEVPKAYCDTAKHECFECIELAHCFHMPGTVCSKGACGCPVAEQTYCGPNDCVDLQIDAKNCGFCGHECFGSCAAGLCADPWEPTVPKDAPAARSRHVAVWTGTQMIVWGGLTDAGYTNTGAAYDPATFKWSAISTVNAPSGRELASVVWTGKVMLVWGGKDGTGALSTGGVYDPATNTWTATLTDGGPSARYNHAVVWTGTDMVVWGGFDGKEQLTTGAMYDPNNQLWQAVKDPPTISRELHSAVYADGKMYAFGGRGDVPGGPTDAYFPDNGYVIATSGLQFDVLLNTWGKLPYANQPAARAGHSAVWTGKPKNVMLVWGGYNGSEYLAKGGVFTPMMLTWTVMNDPQPDGRWRHTAVYLDAKSLMIVWGGQSEKGALDSGGIYDATTNQWMPPPPVTPGPRYYHSAVSTGKSMIIWGGEVGNKRLGDGAVYTP